MTPERFARIRAVLDKRQPDLTVLMENVHKPHNYAAVIRSCDAVGCFEAHGVLYNEQLSNKIASAAGARKWVSVRDHSTIADAIGHLQERKFKVMAAHLSERSIDYRDHDFTEPTCILLGQELDGVTEDALNRVDGELHAPMHGMVESLNVSVAAAVILFEAQRQRTAAGFYAAPRLPP
ncbi:MAG: tRNA (guanosine(18)-2'-O)-methyltransferase TrmH, partial [Myxococcota bacterium]